MKAVKIQSGLEIKIPLLDSRLLLLFFFWGGGGSVNQRTSLVKVLGRPNEGNKSPVRLTKSSSI